MFDLTSGIGLSPAGENIYRRWRWLLYLAVFSGAAYLVYLILFPTAYFTFSVPNPNSTKNNITISELPDKGIVSENKNLQFNASLLGGYTRATVELVLSKKSEPLENGRVAMRKSYQSFFYPQGPEIAYESRIDANGMQSGDLAAYGESVYLISENLIYPIDSIETFIGHGYSWSDLKKVGPDVVASYEKQKLFTLSSPHPDGTILLTDKNDYFLIKNKQKMPVAPASIPELPKREPIRVSQESLDVQENCELRESFWKRRSYSCDMPLEKFVRLLGSDYRLEADLDSEVRLETINVRFQRQFGNKSFRETAAEIIKRIKDNYAQ